MSRAYTSNGWGIDRRTLMQGLGLAGLAAAFSGSASAQSLEAAGPPRVSRFIVEIDGIEAGGFSRVELPDATVANVDYREGSDVSRSARKLSGLNEFDTLVLEKGVSSSSLALYEWFRQVQDGNLEGNRRSIAVTLLDARGEEVARWNFFDAWPARYDAPNLDARTNEVAIERLEIIHERMEREA